MFNIKKWYLCMNKRHFLFSAIGVMFLSFAAALSLSPRTLTVAKADAPVDIGDVRLNLNTGTTESKTANAIHLVCSTTNPVPVLSDWKTCFYSTEANSLTINDIDYHNGKNGDQPVALKKIADNKYYLALGDSGLGSRTTGDIVVLKGNWTATVNDVTYTANLKEFSATWDGSKWVQDLVVPELEPYNRVSLIDLCIEDFNYCKMNTEGDTNNYNSFPASADNPHNNVVFEFYYEANKIIDSGLDIRIGGDKAWDASEHFFLLRFNNSWGPKGLAFIYEKNIAIHGDAEIGCDLTPNVRHKIEFGMITVKDTTSNEVYFYLKNNDELIYQTIYSVKTLQHTNRISFSYVNTNIYLGSTKNQKINTDSLTFNRSEGTDGIYLNGPENDMPLNVRAAPASKYNLYKNNKVLFNFSINGLGPLMKKGTYEYYLSFSENHIEVEEGDIVSIGGEFHLYSNGKTYALAVIPFCVKREGNQFVEIGTLDDYLNDIITNYVNLDDYADDKTSTLQGLIASTKVAVQEANDVKDKWQAFETGKDAIDAIPPKEELLNRVKQQACDKLDSYDNELLYEPSELLIVQGFIETGKSQINLATTIKQVTVALDNTIAQINGVATRQERIEARILSHEEGFEQYLAKSETVTTTDLCSVGSLSFYPFGSSESTYSQADPNTMFGRFVTSSDNSEGNVAFKFNYQSTDPSSKQYQAQIFIRLRGTGTDNYMFRIARQIDGEPGVRVSLGKFENDIVNEKSSVFGFEKNTPYLIEVGAINLKEFDRVYMYIKIDGNVIVEDIVDPIHIPHTPTVLIQDSYTEEGSNETATISPVEEGTTKAENSSRVGRLTLDSSSNNKELIATLRKNSIPVYTNFHPIQQNAFTFDGDELDAYRAGAMVRKISETQYLITTEGLTISDGCSIKVGGCFASYDEATHAKSAIYLSETTFTYHASTNSWTQTEISLDDAINDAKTYLDDYAILEAYSEANQAVIKDIIDNYKNQISAATTVEAVNQLLDAAIAAIDAVPTILGEYKNAAKAELDNYKSPSIYRENEQKQLANLLSEAHQRIDDCGDKDAVDYVVLTTKQAIDQLKTADEYYAEELQSKQRSAKAEIEAFIGKVELDRYSEDNAALIQQLALKARKDVDAATTLEEVDKIVSEFKQAVINLSTADGSVFDGEKYTNRKKKGCGGEIISTTVIVPAISVAALSILIVIRKRKSYLDK